MGKNYADLYNSTNDFLALEQRFYAKLETTKGTLKAPTNADFFYTNEGGSVSFSQPFDSSPHRSGRHHLSTIHRKKECSFTIPTLFNIDETLGAASTSEIDPAIKLLFKSLLGKEDVTGGSPVYNSLTAPDITFSLFEVGDKWSRQIRGAFVQGCKMSFPSNGNATAEWTGNGAEAYYCGIGKSTTANTAHTVTLQTGEGELFTVGGLVMIVKTDGTTLSTDTPAGAPRTITAISGDIVTLSGANLADADGSGSGLPVYLSYYEPLAPVAINNPVVGLVGSVSIASTTQDCFRQVTFDIQNGHELVNYCYGKDTLDDPFFVPGSRLTVKTSVEMNLNVETFRLFNRVGRFEAQDLTLVLGDAAGRRMQVECPVLNFPVPTITLPANGSIPYTLEGNAYESALDAADEITVSFL